jgi:hypothetical protein
VSAADDDVGVDVDVEGAVNDVEVGEEVDPEVDVSFVENALRCADSQEQAASVEGSVNGRARCDAV